jgi:PAS domain S-box-containing protein
VTDVNAMSDDHAPSSHPNDFGFRDLADQAPCVLWMAGLGGDWQYVNPAWTRLSGQATMRATGNGWMAVVSEKSRDALAAAFVKGAADAAAFDVEVCLTTADAAGRKVTLRATPVMQNGKVTGFSGSIAPVDHAPKAVLSDDEQRQLFRNRRELETLVENSPDVIARLGRDQRHLYVNRATRDAFGIEASDFIGKSISEMGFPDSVAAAYDKAAQEVFQCGEERAFNFTLEDSESRTRHFTTRILPEFERDGSIDSVLAVTYDVTQRTEAQLERDALLIREQAARFQAEAASRARDQFLAIVSHELRSPLNGIQSWTHVLENRVDTGTPSVARAIAGIKTGVQQQVRMIEELLDATQVMTGRLRMPKQPFTLQPAIDAAISSASKAAAERNVSVTTAYPELPVRIVGNAERVEQIIWNLLTNAIKFSPQGSDVKVTIETSDIDVRISVVDQGKGISAEFMPFLFDPFRQADSSNTRRTEGLGLGLTLVRQLTELHGGRAVAYSDGENQGSTFSIYLPLRNEADSEDEGPRAVQTVAGDDKPLSSLENVRVLLVDDQKEARDSLSELLTHIGAQVAPTESGQHALDHLRQCGPDDAPQVIICDIAMPDMDGYETLKQVRLLERQVSTRFRGPIPAIALTAFGQREDRVRALANGFQVYLTKPANPAELIAVITSLTRPAAQATPGQRVASSVH